MRLNEQDSDIERTIKDATGVSSLRKKGNMKVKVRRLIVTLCLSSKLSTVREAQQG